ncbi:hypothetical protein GmHk_07G018855 [Glycine max]|nr:hypothetical protein GmHk_07G018855 [Glycine max]
MNFVVGHIYRIELQTIFLSNLDEAPARRRAREAFKDIQLTIDHCLFRVYEVNSRGLKIFSKSWLPESSPLKAIICYCHGYADTCTFYFEGMEISMLNEKSCKEISIIWIWSICIGLPWKV